MIDTLARGSGQLGFDVDVLALSRTPKPETLDMGRYRLHRSQLDFELASTGMSFSVFARFMVLARNADVIHFHFPWPFMDLVHFFACANKPTVVTYHSDIVRQKGLLSVYRPLMNFFLNDVTQIVATSPNYVETSGVLTKFKRKVSVIPIGLDPAKYPAPDPASSEFWRNRFGPRFFLFIGVLRYYKGLHILLEAARDDGYPIVIVGSGPTEHELLKQAGNLGLTNVHFLGFVSDVDKAALLAACYCVVFPSNLRSEAFGISLLEGAYYGKAMISSEIGTGTTFVNINGDTGLVVPPSDSNALRNAMRYLWDNPTMAIQMGDRARKRYLSHFTASRMCQSYADLYRSLFGIPVAISESRATNSSTNLN